MSQNDRESFLSAKLIDHYNPERKLHLKEGILQFFF